MQESLLPPEDKKNYKEAKEIEKESELTKELLNSIFDYKDGELYYKNGRKIYGGRRAGTIGANNRRYIYINKRKIFLEHRIIYILFNGSIPDGMTIDHRDLNPLNNKIENLIPATASQNCQNKGLNALNTTGYTGVSYIKKSRRYLAQIKIRGKVRHLGLYIDKEDAARAYQEAKGKYGDKDFIRTQKIEDDRNLLI